MGWGSGLASLLDRADDLLPQRGVCCVISALRLDVEDPAVAQPVVAHEVVRLEVLVVQLEHGVDDLVGVRVGVRLRVRVRVRLGLGLGFEHGVDDVLQEALEGAVDEEDDLVRVRVRGEG